jgi:uncharacterized lipoprotein YajG
MGYCKKKKMREWKKVKRKNEVKRKFLLLVPSNVMYVCDKCVGTLNISEPRTFNSNDRLSERIVISSLTKRDGCLQCNGD